MQSIESTKVRPDAKGRIFLGQLAKGVSSYTLTQDQGRLILEPNVEIPAREQWLWDNPVALQKVKQGLMESAAGQAKYRGDFSIYANDADEDE